MPSGGRRGGGPRQQHRMSIAASDALASTGSYDALATLASIRAASGIGAFLLVFKADSRPLSLLPGQHVMLSPCAGESSDDDGSVPVGQSRPYSPVGVSVANGTFTFLIKCVPLDAAAPHKGSFSRWLTGLTPGARLRISGPFGTVALDVDACVLHLPNERDGRMALPLRHLTLVAGGSGVTPVAQLLNAVCARLEHAERHGEEHFSNARLVGSPPPSLPPPMDIRVLLSDHTPEHALLTDELDALQGAHPKLISKLHRTFTSLPTGGSSPGSTSTRRIDEDMLRHYLPAPSASSVVLCCGPPGFEQAVAGHLDALGHKQYVLLSSGTVVAPPQQQSAPPPPAPSTLERMRSGIEAGRGGLPPVATPQQEALLDRKKKPAAKEASASTTTTTAFAAASASAARPPRQPPRPQVSAIAAKPVAADRAPRRPARSQQQQRQQPPAPPPEEVQVQEKEEEEVVEADEQASTSVTSDSDEEDETPLHVVDVGVNDDEAAALRKMDHVDRSTLVDEEETLAEMLVRRARCCLRVANR